MNIHILKLCAALLAPESTGLDPHGRALHLPLHEDFNVSYEACIETAKQARRLDVDPFVMLALAYKTTKLSPKLAEKSPIYKEIRRQYGCEEEGPFIRSSCSSFMLLPQFFRSLAMETVRQSGNKIDRLPDYRKSLCRFLKPWKTKCTSSMRKEAKIIENVSFRFANVYGRTFTSFTWHSPFKVQPTQEERRREDDRLERQLDREAHLRNPNLHGMLHGLGYRYSPNPVQSEYTRRDLTLLSELFEGHVPVEAATNNRNTVKFFVHFQNPEQVRESLWYINGNTSKIYENEFYAGDLKEFNGGVYHLILKSRIREFKSIIIKFVPDSMRYQVFIFRK